MRKNRAKAHQIHRARRISLVRFLLLACAVLFPGSLSAANNSIALDIALQSIKSARPPYFIGSDLIFTYRPRKDELDADRFVHYVGIRFAHEGYSVLHTYERNGNGVFVFDYPVPEGLKEIRYRIVVDGLWMSDPANPSLVSDALGNQISLFVIENPPVRAPLNPAITADGTLTFVYQGEAGKRVSLAGDWNDWDPFIEYLMEVSPGLYRISVRVRPGRHFYYFFSEGRRILDRFNPENGRDPEGNPVSSFVLPS